MVLLNIGANTLYEQKMKTIIFLEFWLLAFSGENFVKK